MVCLRCIGPSHPLWEKLPLRISIGVGALASTSPVASHIPDGGLDSRNLSEALRKRPATPDELLDPAASRLVGCLVGVVGDASPLSLVAMMKASELPLQLEVQERNFGLSVASIDGILRMYQW